jgi:hypothetical protein
MSSAGTPLPIFSVHCVNELWTYMMAWQRCDENQNLRGEISQLKAKLSETVEAEPCPPIEQRQPERHFDTVYHPATTEAFEKVG